VITVRWADDDIAFPQVEFRRLFRPLKREVPPDAAMVTAYTDGAVTLRSNRLREGGYHEATDMSGMQGVHTGDFVVHGLDILRGSVGISDSTGAISSVCVLCEPTAQADPRYFAWVIRAQAFSGFPRALARGVREGGADFRRWDTLAELPVPAPPMSVQTAIADYLDTETARIDTLISKKQRMIWLINQRFTTVVDHLVWGASEDVGWSENLPAGWTSQAFSVSTTVAEGQVDPRLEQFRDLPLIAPNHIESGTGRILFLESAAGQEAISGKYLCLAGDVIYSKIRPSLCKVAIAPERCLTSADMYPIRPSKNLTPRFLLYFLLSRRFTDLAVLESERVAMPKINRDALGRVRMPIPPLYVQDEIVSSLDRESSYRHRMAVTLDKQIVLLQERRQALITAAVTGQLDIPEVAA
jgi:type I restriction enzyme S subunit